MFGKLYRWVTRSDTDRRIDRHGWTGIYVGDYSTAPTWVYSIGFTEALGRPEVVVFDLPQAAANGILWQIFRELKDGRLQLVDGATWDTADHLCVWRKVHQSQIESDDRWFTLALMRHALVSGEMDGVEVFQLVLSDEDGHLPWDAEYDERLRERQPALWEQVDLP